MSDFGGDLGGDAGHDGSHHYDQGHHDSHTPGTGSHGANGAGHNHLHHIQPAIVDPELLDMGEQLSSEEIGNAMRDVKKRGHDKVIDHSKDVITKPTEAAVPAAGKVAKAEEQAAGFVQRVKAGLKTTKGKVGAGILATGVVLGSVMTYNHFKNKDDSLDSQSR